MKQLIGEENMLAAMTDSEVIDTIGNGFINGVFESENSDLVAAAFKEISAINEQLFLNIPFQVIFTEDDCYSSAKEMRARVIEEKVIYIYKGGSDHPFYTEQQNWISRAVHDVFAHMVCGCPFSFEGEYNAYLEQRKYYPEWTWGVLFAEIPAQTAGYYHAKGFNFPQRAFNAPEEWLIECEQRFVRDYSENSVMKPLYI